MLPIRVKINFCIETPLQRFKICQLPRRQQTNLITNFLRIPLSHVSHNPMLRRSTMKENIVVILNGSGSIRNWQSKTSFKKHAGPGRRSGLQQQACAGLSHLETVQWPTSASKPIQEAWKRMKQIPYYQAGPKEAKSCLKIPHQVCVCFNCFSISIFVFAKKKLFPKKRIFFFKRLKNTQHFDVLGYHYQVKRKILWIFYKYKENNSSLKRKAT